MCFGSTPKKENYNLSNEPTNIDLVYFVLKAELIESVLLRIRKKIVQSFEDYHFFSV